VFGWTHILREVYVPLRQRVAARGTATTTTELPPIVRYDVEETSTADGMLLVIEPGPLRGVLLISPARSVVVLPGPDDDRTLEEVTDALVALVPNGDERSFNGVEIDWPTQPNHSRDPDPPA
jgi:hypothetical protein